MLETLYRTANPEDSLEDGEYYTLFLSNRQDGRYSLIEKHGWWDEAQRRSVNHTTTLSPEDGYGTFEEALQDYNRQKHYRVGGGFVHCFSPGFNSEGRTHHYELLTISNQSR